VGDAEVDAVKSFTKAWMRWRCLEGRQKTMARQEDGEGWAGISYDTQQTNRAHSYLIFVRYFTKLLTVE
jgi:hypothetical protein